MYTKSKRILSALLAMLILITGLLPLSVFAADVTMDLSKCEVSWDFTLNDEEGNPFEAAYGIYGKDNSTGYNVLPMRRKMHDYTAKRPGIGQNGYMDRTLSIAIALSMGFRFPTAVAIADRSIPHMEIDMKRSQTAKKTF